MIYTAFEAACARKKTKRQRIIPSSIFYVGIIESSSDQS
jgi:hypothetical protein